MLLSSKKNIDDLIVESLGKKPQQTGPLLVESIRKIRPKTTKQAVYISLKSLLKDEIISKAGNKYFVTQFWLRKIDSLFDKQTEKKEDAVFDLKETESISYKFPSMLSCDTYWAHLFDLMVQYTPKEQPVIFWMPHEWFIIGRKENDLYILNLFTKYKKLGLYTIQGKTKLDLLFKKEYSNPFLKINTGGTFSKKDNYYMNVFGDFVVEIYMSPQLSTKIDEFYKKNQNIEKYNTQEMESFIEEKHPVRMKISRNKKRAIKLRKQLSKDFYIPSEYET